MPIPTHPSPLQHKIPYTLPPHPSPIPNPSQIKYQNPHILHKSPNVTIAYPN